MPRSTELSMTLRGSYRTLASQAAKAEEHGLEAVWVSETYRDAFVLAAVAIQATKKVKVGTSIAIAFARTPTLAAMSSWDLNELSRGRFRLGLGTQVKKIVEERYSANFSQPAKRMGEYLQVVRAVHATSMGEFTPFEGDFYTVTRPAFHNPPAPGSSPPALYLGAVGPQMRRQGVLHADGILGHSLSTLEYLRDSYVPSIEEGVQAEGKDPGNFFINSGVIVSVDEDRERAFERAKRQIAFYGSTPNYSGVFDYHNEVALTEDFRRAWKTGDVRAMVAAVPDAAVDRYAVAGTPSDVRDKLTEYAGLLDSLKMAPAWFSLDDGELEDHATAVMEAVRDLRLRPTLAPTNDTGSGAHSR